MLSEKKALIMAEHFPPDDKKKIGRGRSNKSGKVANLSYASSGQSDEKESSRKKVSRTRNFYRTKKASNHKKMGRPRRIRSEQTFVPHMQPGQSYAALDLGTNNCRLLIARPTEQSFTVIDAFSRVVKLGHNLTKTGRLSDEAMERTIQALLICAEKLRKRNVFLARSVATEACRRATNGEAFIKRVREETGIALDIISAEEEARLAVLGCQILLEPGNGPAVIFDIGGGSTELVLLENRSEALRVVDWLSVPWGVVSLTDTVGRVEGNADRREAIYKKMRSVVDESFAGFASRLSYWTNQEGLRLLGTSGTVTTLASLHLKLSKYDRNAVDGLIVPSQAMREITQMLSRKSLKSRARVPCIGNDRADLVVAGCAILESILDIWPARQVGVADRGIREGILRSLMANDLAHPHPIVCNISTASLESTKKFI